MNSNINEKSISEKNGGAGRAVYFLVAAFYLLLYYFTQFAAALLLLFIARKSAEASLGVSSGEEYNASVSELVSKYSDIASIAAAVFGIVLVALSFLAYRRLVGAHKLPALSFFSLKRPSLSDALLSLALGFTAYHFVALYLNVCRRLFPNAFESYGNASQSIVSESFVIANLILLAIVTPIYEELIFRNRLIDSFVSAGLPSTLAVLISSLIFGAAHGNMIWVIYAVAIGLIFGFMYTSKGSLFLSMLAHSVFNLTGFIYGKLSGASLSSSGRDALNLFYSVFLYSSPVLLAAVLFAFFGLPLLRKRRALRDKERKL